MKLTPELEADIRSKVNPQYRDHLGTESYERDALLGEIDRLRIGLFDLLHDVIAQHADPADPSYNECDISPCEWCEKAMEIMAPSMVCHRCGGSMKPSKAIAQTWGGEPEWPGDTIYTMSPAGPGKLIDCLKCEKCGYSVTNDH